MSSVVASPAAGPAPPSANRAVVPPGTPPERNTIREMTPLERTLRVAWADGHVSDFHYIWLRHQCYCPYCGTSDTGIRRFQLIDVPRDIAPSSVTIDGSGDVVIVWTGDSHVSHYAPEWLRAYCYSERERRRRRSFRPTLWGSEILADLPTANYREIRNDPERLLVAMEALRDYGIVQILELGTDPADTERLAALFGPIHPTSNYGHVYDVQAKATPKIGGQTQIHQNPHCDDTFQYTPPGVVFFHYLANTTGPGGESSFADGFAVADSLRREEPACFRLLCEIPVQFNRRHRGEFDMRGQGRVICLDEDGNLAGIRYFDRAAAPLDAPADCIEAMFEAQRQFLQRVTSPAFKIEFKATPGSGMIVDNHRVMHGRNAFEAGTGRWLRTCTTDREEFHARLRDLAQRFGRPDYDLALPAGCGPA